MASGIVERVRGQRISPREVISEAQEKLLQSGCLNCLRAKYISLLASAVAASDSPIFFQQRANIRKCHPPAWLAAYTLVFQYLDDNRLDLTRATSLTECPDLEESHSFGPRQPGDGLEAEAQNAESSDPFARPVAKSLADLASDGDDVECPLPGSEQGPRRHLSDRDEQATGKGSPVAAPAAHSSRSPHHVGPPAGRDTGDLASDD
jgi:hypothetical protein